MHIFPIIQWTKHKKHTKNRNEVRAAVTGAINSPDTWVNHQVMCSISVCSVSGLSHQTAFHCDHTEHRTQSMDTDKNKKKALSLSVWVWHQH